MDGWDIGWIYCEEDELGTFGSRVVRICLIIGGLAVLHTRGALVVVR